MNLRLRPTAAFALAALLLLGGCAEGAPAGGVPVDSTASIPPHSPDAQAELAAPALDSVELTPRITARTLPDMGLFFGRKGEPAVGGTSGGIQNVPLTELTPAMVLEYLDLLTGQFGYEIVARDSFDPALEDPFKGHFTADTGWEVALAKNGAELDRRLKSYGVQCDLILRGYGTAGVLTLSYAPGLVPTDTGCRWSGWEGDEVNKVTGQRAGEEYRLADGRYFNGGDGALSAPSGGVCVLADGAPAEASGTLTAGTYLSRPSYDYVTRCDLELTYSTSGGDGGTLRLGLPTELTAGDLFCLSDFISNHRAQSQSGRWKLEWTARGGETAFAADFSTSAWGSFESAAVRVLRWDESGEGDCLLYVHAAFWVEEELVDLECLAALPLSEAESGSSAGGPSGGGGNGSEPFQPDASKQDCFACHGSGDCQVCGGDGYDSYGDAKAGCYRCHGTGKCTSCGGTGKRD